MTGDDDVQPLILPISSPGQAAGMIVFEVGHEHEFNVVHRRTVIAFTELDGEIVGASTAILSGLDYDEKAKSGLDPSGMAGSILSVTASIDFRGIPGPRLTAAAVLLAPWPGGRVRLARAEPQGIVPEDLILDAELDPPSGPAPAVMSVATGRYSEHLQGPTVYRTVTVRHGGESMTAPAVAIRH
jgi:hypothetical protein